MENLSQRLVDKSIEAFIMGLEIYNKPTIKYRVEGFSFFICNAWELMLKAQILKEKGEHAIYFKDNQNRTISLENSIDIIFPDKHGSLRKNLLHIVELRNTSTHFITEDYEHIYVPLFQACVFNYTDKLKEFHNKDITTQIAQNFLTLSVRINELNQEEIRAKYSPEMAKRLLADIDKIKKSIYENNTDYAIPIETKFYITKKKDDADLLIKIDNSSDEKISIVRDIKNPNDVYPHTMKEVIKIINKKLKTENILLNKIVSGEKTKSIFTTHDFQLFNQFYNIKQNSKYSFHYKIGNRFGYSHILCDFIIEEIKKDPINFVSNLKKGIKK